MKKKVFFLVLGAFAIAVGLIIVAQRYRTPTERSSTSAVTPPSSEPEDSTKRVPAHYTSPPVTLKPTLAPEQFKGATRDAYRVVKEVPETIAQMPCYCHCDRGFGHKSLHSCFEDDHAAHCAVCVDEALLAYRLQKEGFSAAQIRARIIAQFGG